ncbi:MAG: haloacid dehalogenase-like hydrolase [Planctomycetota bacterium]
MNRASSVLVTDFDGTVTEFDFYRQASPLLPHDLPDYWEEYRGGRMTHFEALAAIFKHLKVSEAELMAVARSTRPDPKFAESVGRLQEVGWDVVVCSAGCQWYIERLLAEQGLNLAVHGNPGIRDPARGL